MMRIIMIMMKNGGYVEKNWLTMRGWVWVEVK